LMSLAYSAARAERYDLLVQTWTLKQGLAFRAGRRFYPQTFDELAGEIVAVEENGSTHDIMRRLREDEPPLIRPAPDPPAAPPTRRRAEGRPRPRHGRRRERADVRVLRERDAAPGPRRGAGQGELVPPRRAQGPRAGARLDPHRLRAPRHRRDARPAGGEAPRH